MFAFYISYFFMGLHIEGALGLSPTASGMVPLLYGLGFGASVVFDRTLDRLRPDIALPSVFALIAVIYGLMAWMSPFYFGLLALSFLWGVSQHIGLNLTVARLTCLDPGQRGAVMGLYSTVTYLCVFIAPLVGGSLYTLYGLAGCLIISGICAALESVEARVSFRNGRSAAPPA
jgi:predicted MFS family arabinose efflux permease